MTPGKFEFQYVLFIAVVRQRSAYFSLSKDGNLTVPDLQSWDGKHLTTSVLRLIRFAANSDNVTGTKLKGREVKCLRKIMNLL